MTPAWGPQPQPAGWLAAGSRTDGSMMWQPASKGTVHTTIRIRMTRQCHGVERVFTVANLP
jgi:hypothetical protein